MLLVREVLWDLGLLAADEVVDAGSMGTLALLRMLVGVSVGVLNVLDRLACRLRAVGLLHGEHHRLQQWPSSAPVDGWVLAHIVAEDLLLLKQLNELRLLDVLVCLVRREVRSVHDLVRRATFDFLQDLLLSLNFEDHLNVNVLNVEILLRDHQRSRIGVQVVQRVVAAWSRHATEVLPSVVQAQAVVSSVGLLERIDRIGLHILSIASLWQAALGIVKL